MDKRKPIGYAVRFNESESTFKHLDILRDYGEVLWGQWRKPGSVAQFSGVNKQLINDSGTFIYAIGQTTVWKMHIKEVLSAEEIKQKELEFLIPCYYDINTPCYCWYLIDDIKDYGSKECLTTLFTSGGKSFTVIHQIPGNSPFRVFSTGNEQGIIKYTPKTIPRAYNPERNKLTAKLRYEILKRDQFRCVLCGRSAAEDGVKLHVDHFIPVARGGLTIENNLRTLCQDCNLGKSDSMPIYIGDKLIG